MIERPTFLVFESPRREFQSFTTLRTLESYLRLWNFLNWHFTVFGKELWITKYSAYRFWKSLSLVARSGSVRRSPTDAKVEGGADNFSFRLISILVCLVLRLGDQSVDALRLLVLILSRVG